MFATTYKQAIPNGGQLRKKIITFIKRYCKATVGCSKPPLGFLASVSSNYQAMKAVFQIIIFFGVINLSFGQAQDSLIISTNPCLNFDFCKPENVYKGVDLNDSTLKIADSSKCGFGSIYSTNKKRLIFMREAFLTGDQWAEGFLTAITYPRKFAGIRLKPKKCFYRKIGAWKRYSGNGVIDVTDYKNDGPVVLDNLPIHYADISNR